MTLDTLKVARRLREAGFSEPQADALVAAVQEGAEGADLATKGDLTLLATELRGEMREMEQRLTARMEAIRAESMTRMATMILSAVLVNVVAVFGAMFAAVRLLSH